MKRLFLIPLVFCAVATFAGPTVTPYTTICPIDGELASYTGQQRILNGQQECRYKHIWIHMNNDHSTTIDEPHIFWAPCEESK